jgi:hypothetical protein
MSVSVSGWEERSIAHSTLESASSRGKLTGLGEETARCARWGKQSGGNFEERVPGIKVLGLRACSPRKRSCRRHPKAEIIWSSSSYVASSLSILKPMFKCRRVGEEWVERSFRVRQRMGMNPVMEFHRKCLGSGPTSLSLYSQLRQPERATRPVHPSIRVEREEGIQKKVCRSL